MRKLVSIENIYTYAFNAEAIKVTENPFVGFVRELVNYPEIPSDKTLYFRWLNDLLIEHGSVWGSINNVEDIVQRVDTLRNLIKKVQEHGYTESLSAPLFVRDGKVYGDLTCYMEGDRYILIDGHHRISILFVLGYTKIVLTICEQ